MFIYLSIHFCDVFFLSSYYLRDIKPANILVSCSDCSIRIADFGLSRVVEADSAGVLYPMNSNNETDQSGKYLRKRERKGERERERYREKESERYRESEREIQRERE